MANRRAPALHAQGEAASLFIAAEAAVESARNQLPPKPARLRRLLDAFALGESLPGSTRPADLVAALNEIRSAVYSAEGYTAECAAMWREAVATAWIAAALARRKRASPGAAGLAGLLHRSGEALALQAVSAQEATAALLLDPATRTQFCAEHGAELTQALARKWRLATPVAVAMTGWRRVGESAALAEEARIVYGGHTLATRSLFSDFRTPGLESALADTLGLSAADLAALQPELDSIRDAAVRFKA